MSREKLHRYLHKTVQKCNVRFVLNVLIQKASTNIKNLKCHDIFQKIIFRILKNALCDKCELRILNCYTIWCKIALCVNIIINLLFPSSFWLSESQSARTEIYIEIYKMSIHFIYQNLMKANSYNSKLGQKALRYLK